MSNGIPGGAGAGAPGLSSASFPGDPRQILLALARGGLPMGNMGRVSTPLLQGLPTQVQTAQAQSPSIQQLISALGRVTTGI